MRRYGSRAQTEELALDRTVLKLSPTVVEERIKVDVGEFVGWLINSRGLGVVVPVFSEKSEVRSY